MRFFTTEGPVHYARYTFSYQHWLQLEPGEPAHPAYDLGYLPYSADPQSPHGLFYRARSLRIPLPQLQIAKKRRYDHRAWLAFSLHSRLFEKDAFLQIHSPDALCRLAQEWMAQRFDAPYLPPDRFHFLLKAPSLSHILAWFQPNGELAAFAFLVLDAPAAHYWFCFYPAPPDQPHPQGHGFLTDCLLTLQSHHPFTFAYLGTAYGMPSRYKSRGLHPVQFWDGQQWSADRSDLHHRQSLDPAHS